MTDPRPTPKQRCPVCRAPTVAAMRPFCSKKCADTDLNRWLSETYVIADGGSDADEDGDTARARSAPGPGADSKLKH